MHALNLCIGYGVGLKENMRSMQEIDPKTKCGVKRSVVVTQGGEFQEGAQVIRKLRALNKYFASSKSPQRIDGLKQVQKFHKLPQLAALIDVDVRVAFVVKLLQIYIVNYPAFRL
ncbi:hypothetical protein V7S43_012721 [Phytophthora oleae]|uniref:Uncharacterized protein n=1 Tax=Phytophthora oleae TaxID=2107226 RepID=A0ABD3FA58_9STRA